MSYKIKVNQAAFKDTDTSQYFAVDVLAEQTKTGLISEIQQAGEEIKADQVAAMEAKGQEVIDSIPEDYSTLQGEVDDLEDTVDSIKYFYSKEAAMDLSPTGYSVYIKADNVWSAASESHKSLIQEIPEGASFIEIKANTENDAYIAFLKTNSHAAGETPDFAEGQSGRITVPIGEKATYIIPNDAEYLYVVKSNTSTIRTPEYLNYFSYNNIPEVDDELETAGDAADAKVTGAKFRMIDNILFKQETLTLSQNTGYSAIINTSNVWSVGANRKSWIQSIPEDAITLTVVANSLENSVIAFLKTNSHVSNESPDYATGSQRETILAGTKNTYDIPYDAKYIYINNYYQETVRAPETAYYTKPNLMGTSYPLGLHEKPASESILNIIKRCRQFTDIEWTPAVDLDRLLAVQRELPAPESSDAQYYLGKFKAGTKYKGIPYGRVSQSVSDYGYSYGTVGNYIGFDTFVSSVSNPESRVCKIDFGLPANHRSIIYATVCSGMTCYALDRMPEIATAQIPSISGLSLIGKLNDSGQLLDDNLIKIGDILNKEDYHTAIITDIIRDDSGLIQYVEISEATVSGLADRNFSDGLEGGICRRKGWNRATFYKSGWWGEYSVYRYSGEVSYTPSPYVNIGDEFDDWRVEHFPLMPYEGENFKYKVEYIPNNAIKLIISLDGYNYVKVFKDDVEISGSPFAITSDTKNIDITEISAGNYSAFLCNITDGNVINLTYPCHWSIT